MISSIDVAFVASKAELFVAIFIQIEWEPVVHYDSDILAIDKESHRVTAGLICLLDDEVVSDSRTELLVSDVRRVFSQTCDSRQEVAVRTLALDDVSWRNTVEHNSI